MTATQQYIFKNIANYAISLAVPEIREDTINEIKEHIGSKAVPIKGTSYSCGPREWVKFIEEVQ